MKIGNYTDDEILEFMTEGEGRGFLGRSMFDAMYFEIERLKNIIKEVKEHIEKCQCCDGKINVMTLTEYKELLEILDKENNNEKRND